jgi:hypothetical protein
MRGGIMKRSIVAVLSVLAVAAGVGWKVASHPETSARLQDIRLEQQSEHSQPRVNKALAGIRIRIAPNDVGDAVRAPAGNVPQISLAVE